MAKTPDMPLEALRKAVRDTERRSTALAEICDQIQKGSDIEPMEAVPVLEEAVKRIERAARDATAALSRVIKPLTRRVEAERDTYASRVVDAIEERGLAVSGSKSRPVVAGCVYVEIDVSQPEVRVNGRRLKDLRISNVVAQIDRTRSALEDAAMPYSTFLEKLEWAYNRIVSETGATRGAQVRISDIHFWMTLSLQSAAFRRDPRASAFKEYPTEHFRSDLYNALADPHPTPSGSLLRVESGAETKGALFMLLPSLGRTGYVGRLWLERDRHD